MLKKKLTEAIKIGRRAFGDGCQKKVWEFVEFLFDGLFYLLTIAVQIVGNLVKAYPIWYVFFDGRQSWYIICRPRSSSVAFSPQRKNLVVLNQPLFNSIGFSTMTMEASPKPPPDGYLNHLYHSTLSVIIHNWKPKQKRQWTNHQDLSYSTLWNWM